jgi:hypothetical protein
MSDKNTKQTNTPSLDNKLFSIVSLLLLSICLLLAVNLFLQWNNYAQAINTVIQDGTTQHSLILTYSRAMDFAFTKTSTIFLGFILVFVGALYILRLEEAAYQVEINNDNTGVTLQTASPGLVLVTLGVIMIIATTYNKSYVSYLSSVDMNSNITNQQKYSGPQK